MITITANENEYTLEYSFEAAEYKSLVQKMFDMMTGAYLVKGAEDIENPTAADMINGTSAMFANIPETCAVAIYAGLLEHNPVSEGEAKNIMRAYMKENNKSYNQLFEDIKKCMEDDGFFHLTGLDEMIQQMASQAEPKTKTPQDHKKKSTGTK